MGLFGLSKRSATEPSAALGEATLPDGARVQVARRVDCIGDSCPRPQIMTKNAVGALAVGQVVEVLVDNPTSVEALPPMCPGLAATHLATVKDRDCWRVYIRKD